MYRESVALNMRSVLIVKQLYAELKTLIFLIINYPKLIIKEKVAISILLRYITEQKTLSPIRTDIMNEFRSPAIKGRFFSESTVWFQIVKKYKKKYINKALRLYEIHADSVSAKKQPYRNYFSMLTPIWPLK